VLNVDGTPQVVTQTQKRVVGLSLAGKLLWSVPFTTPYDQNSVTPVAAGDRVILGGTRQPTFALRPRREGGVWKAERLWQTRDATLYMSTPVLVGGRLYGMSERYNGQLFSLEPGTGKVGWTGPARFGDNASLTVAGSAVLALPTDGALRVYLPEGAGLREAARYQVADGAVWASPAASGRTLLIKDAAALSRWDLP
jgi:outer membrane protein assembly factor BamB